MRVILSIYCLFVVSLSFSQGEVIMNLVPEKNKLEIGEPVSVKLTIDFPAEKSNQQIILPMVTDSAKLGEGIEIWETSPPIDTFFEASNGSYIKHIEQDFTIASFDTGLVDLYPLKAVFDGDTIYSNAVTISISAMPLEADTSTKALKPIEEDPFTTWEKIMIWLKTFWWIILIIILIPIIILIVIYFIKKKPKKIEVKEVIPLNVRTLDELDKIEAAKLWQENKYKRYYSRITGVIWEYLAERYEIATFEKTSDEILEQLKFKAVTKDQFIQLQKLMELADLVKFAKTIPSPTDNESALKIAREFIHATYASQSENIDA